MILGAPDVVPHQDLENPAYKPGDDDDRMHGATFLMPAIPPYGRDPAKFVGPTRVVGRLPDLSGEGALLFIGLLKTAAE